MEQAPLIMRFLNLYKEVMSVQMKKTSYRYKAQFNKVARRHFNAVFQVWTFFHK